MAEANETHLVRGLVAGIAGGLVASWVMNVFIEGAGQKLTEAAENATGQTPAQQSQDHNGAKKDEVEQDVTMKTADAVVAAVTGGRHLSFEEQQKGGPVVHYVFGALMGGAYGALAEYVPAARSGFGTVYGAGLFGGADLVAVPALHLSNAVTDAPASTLVTPFAAHLVYGVTTEMVRRLMRAIL